MALLVFDDAGSSPVGDLLEASQRQKTASELNAAILSSQSQVRPGSWSQMGMISAVDEVGTQCLLLRQRSGEHCRCSVKAAKQASPTLPRLVLDMRT